MTQDNVDLIKSVHPPSGTNLSSLFAQGAMDSAALEQIGKLLTPECEVVGGDLRGGAGLSLAGRGIEGLLVAWRDWLEPWESYWTQVEDFIDAGEHHVVVLVRDHGRLRGSDFEVENVAASVWTVREGRITRIEFHTDRPQAFKAAGLAEQAGPRG